jgi:organic radical activating enzyme
MFGKNPIREVERDPASVAVQEIFYTLQGEGPFAGHVAPFVRLAGCNLACTFCDTDFETNIGQRYTPSEVVAHVHLVSQVCKYPAEAMKVVVLTGGEPLRQSVIPTIAALFNAGVKVVQIETAGTLWEPDLEHYLARPHHEDPRVVLVCSPKTPKIHPMVARYCDHYKYVIDADRVAKSDGLPVGGTQHGNEHVHHELYRPWHDSDFKMRNITIWVSPMDPGKPVPGMVLGVNGSLTLADIWQRNTRTAAEIALRHGYRLTLQMHKLVGLP